MLHVRLGWPARSSVPPSLKSFWASRDGLAASEQAAALHCGELARHARGSVSSEQYQLPVFEREALRGGEEVRITRIEVKASAVADVTEVFGDSAVPWLAETIG